MQRTIYNSNETKEHLVGTFRYRGLAHKTYVIVQIFVLSSKSAIKPKLLNQGY